MTPRMVIAVAGLVVVLVALFVGMAASGSLHEDNSQWSTQANDKCRSHGGVAQYEYVDGDWDIAVCKDGTAVTIQ